MILETLETLDVLRTRGVRTAAARYVTSADEAVAFAEGERQAIALRVVAAPPAACAVPPGESGLTTTAAIADAFARFQARAESVASGRVLALRTPEPGVDVAVEYSEDLMLGRTVEIRGGGVRVDRLAPVDAAQAVTMADEFCSKRGLPPDGKAMRALADLVVEAERVFQIAGVERVLLDPVRLHDDTYVVVDATIETCRRIRARKPRATRSKRR